MDDVSSKIMSKPVVSLILLAALPAQRTTRIVVDATVVDESGRPVVAAEFADAWGFRGARWHGSVMCAAPGQKAPLRTDDQGRLRGTWVMSPFEAPLLGLSADRRMAAFCRPTADERSHEFAVRGRIVLHPAITLRGRVRTSLGVAKGSLRLVVTFAKRDDPSPEHFVFVAEAPAFALPLPPGSYQIRLTLGYGHAPPRTAVLAPGRDAVDIGPITVPRTPFDLIGEVLPDWEPAAAKNIPLADATLGHFRGKPLLIAFDEWGGRLSTGSSIRPGLAAVATHPRRSAFGVILFDTSMRAQGQTSKPLGPAVEELFPLVRPTVASNADSLYGSRWAIIVLDPDGRLVHCGRDVASAVATLEKLLK